LKIILIERIVERCNDPMNPNYPKVTSMSTKTIDMYTSDVIPRKGEIIYIDEDTAYDVVEVIYQKHKYPLPSENNFTVHVEVSPHFNFHTYKSVVTDTSFVEEWPIITKLPMDMSWFNCNCSDDESDDCQDFL